MQGITFPFIVSVISAAVAGVFTVIIFNRWRVKRRPHYLAWGIGLALYFLGTLSQVILALGWSSFFFRMWYWSGAIITAAWLGQGTVYLLVRRGNIARNIQMALLLVSIMTFLWMFITPLTPLDPWPQGADMTQIYKQIMPTGPGTVRSFAVVMNIWGTIALVGGAIWSSWLFRRKQIMPNRVYGNWLIAAGGLAPALGGALTSLGSPAYNYFGIMLGAILIFVGFYLATTVPEEAAAPRRESAQNQAAGD